MSSFGIERNLSFGEERSLKGLVWYPKGVTPQRVKGDTLFLGQSCSAAEIPRICAFVYLQIFWHLRGCADELQSLWSMCFRIQGFRGGFELHLCFGISSKAREERKEQDVLLSAYGDA